MKRLYVLGLAMLAAPAAGQEPAPPAVAAAPPVVAPPAPAGEPIDPARLALAAQSIDFVWPTGTYARMMDGAMNQMMDSMMSSMFDMRMKDLNGSEGGAVEEALDDLDPQASNATIREMIAKQDPHFEERMRISNRVMMAEMTPLLNRIEPQVREGLSRAFARRFSAVELADMNRFFATPSGRAYGRDSMLLFMDPEVLSRMAAMVPEMVKEMPAIMQKVGAATAHLPLPAPKKKGKGKTRR